VIDSGRARERVVSSSLLILEALLPALISGAQPVEVELVPGTIVINRVTPFAPGPGPAVVFDGEYTVSRIATQRKPDGSDEHLEVFLKKKGSQEEKAYNVFDPFLQQILIAAFGMRANPPLILVAVYFDGDEIATVSLGQGN
jgi:hypothetical protein